MKVPNAEHAIIASEKLSGYLLNLSHRRGVAKARLLLSFGYRSDNARAREADLRFQHLPLDVTGTSTNAHGVVYEIEGPIRTPSGRDVTALFGLADRHGTDVPRFITMCPR